MKAMLACSVTVTGPIVTGSISRPRVPSHQCPSVSLAAPPARNMSGEKRTEEETSGEDRRRCERRFGALRRVIELPQPVDAEGAEAESENGVVTVRVPKRPDAQPRQIEIKPAGGAKR